MGGYLCTRTERDGRIWLLPPLMYHPWCDLKKKQIVRKAVLLRPTEKWVLIYRSLEPTATCQLLVLHCFYGMRRCRRLKMAYFEQLLLICFCKHMNCTLYGKHLCEILNISPLSNSQYLIWISCIHLLPFMALSGILHRSVLGPLHFSMFINVLCNVTNYSTCLLSTNYTNIFRAQNSINDCTLLLLDTNFVWN